MALCAARDEVHWLLRHSDNPPQTKSKGKAAEDLVDRQLPELLFHMEELRGLNLKKLTILIHTVIAIYWKFLILICL